MAKLLWRCILPAILILLLASLHRAGGTPELLHQIAGVGKYHELGEKSRNSVDGISKSHTARHHVVKAESKSSFNEGSASGHGALDFDFSLFEELASNGVRHPLIFWPGFGTSSIEVRVQNQRLDPDCPQYGTFHASFGNPTILEGWSESCVYKMLELDFDAKSKTFASKPGISTSVADFGSTSCAYIPYEPLYLFLEAVGYTIGLDFFVACYDWRMTPYTDVGTDLPHLEMAKQLVEQAFHNTGLPVYLSGHSNGPLYTLALLNSVSEEWRRKYVAGFIGMAGNWAGQGGTLAFLFSGQSLFDSSWYPDSASAWQSWPAAYMQLADPSIFGSQEVLLEAEVKGKKRRYTPEDYESLFKDASMPQAREFASMFVGNVSAARLAPNTHFYGFYGSGSLTRIGVTLSKLGPGKEPVEDADFYRDGDGDQEDLDNLSALKWRGSPAECLHFELNEMSGSTHLGLPLSWRTLYKLAQIVYTAPPKCNSSSIKI